MAFSSTGTPASTNTGGTSATTSTTSTTTAATKSITGSTILDFTVPAGQACTTAYLRDTLAPHVKEGIRQILSVDASRVTMNTPSCQPTGRRSLKDSGEKRLLSTTIAGDFPYTVGGYATTAAASTAVDDISRISTDLAVAATFMLHVMNKYTTAKN